MSKAKKVLIVSDCLVKALAFDLKKTELQVYRLVMDQVDQWGEVNESRRRQFHLKGSSIGILIKFNIDSITIIPLKNKIIKAEDHTKFLGATEAFDKDFFGEIGAAITKLH